MIACPKCDKGKKSKFDYAPKEITGNTDFRCHRTHAEIECKGCGGILWASSSWIMSRAVAIRDERYRLKMVEAIFRATGDERISALVAALHRVSDRAAFRSGKVNGFFVPGGDWRALQVACRAFTHTDADPDTTCPGCGIIFASAHSFGEHLRAGCRYGAGQEGK